MSIQRQYSLPNCTLMLEGWGNDLPLAGASTTRPVLSILTSATCLFAGHEKPLTGGREFFESFKCKPGCDPFSFTGELCHGRDATSEFFQRIVCGMDQNKCSILYIR